MPLGHLSQVSSLLRKNMAKITPFGGAGSATGANFLFEIGGRRILIDCGMQQGDVGAGEHNRKPFDYDPSSIELLFVTHAHIDHVGLIPKLVKNGFKGEIYSTEETRAIGQLLLLDAVKINHQNSKGAHEKEPLYTQEDVARSMTLWKTLQYHTPHDFGEFTVELFDAGHVLGSSMFKLTTPAGKNIVFTGDLGNSPSPLLRDREVIEGVDYLLMESVYGDRNHEDRQFRDEKFELIVRDSIKRGGTLLIPAFSLERTQEILASLDNLFESKKLPSVPVFLDSPLGEKITAVYEKVKDLYNAKVLAELKGGDDLFRFKELREIARWQESQEIKHIQGPKIIIAGSGMSTAGRIIGHEEHFLPDPHSTLLLMGYQAVGTLGRKIEEGNKKVMIDDKEVVIRAHIEKIDGFSGHADSNALVEFVSHTEKTVKKVFVAMGEPQSQIFLAQRLRDELGVDAVVTQVGKSYEIDM